VANALAAFWAFQGWGNDPDLYDASFKDTISGFLTQRGDVDAATLRMGPTPLRASQMSER
jgi:hypothetical protein